MALKKKKSKPGIIAFVALCLVVLISGFALWQNNNLQNPLQTTSMLFSTQDGVGRERLDRAEGERPEPSEGMDIASGEQLDGGADMTFWDIEWDQLGSVFYNLWVILVSTILVIVIARPVGWLVKWIKSHRKSAVV